MSASSVFSGKIVDLQNALTVGSKRFKVRTRFQSGIFLTKTLLIMINTNYLDCIEACQACLVDCQNCLMEMAGKKSMNDCPACCVQCVDACTICLKMMAGGGKFATDYCELCAKVCDYCAEQCEAHDHDHCQRCAESCRKCAEACRALAQKAVSGNMN